MADRGKERKLQVECAEGNMRVAVEVGELEDCSPLLAAGDFAALRARLAEDGALLLRGVHDREAVLRARLDVVAWLRRGGKLAESSDETEARIGDGQKGTLLTGCRPVTHTESMLAVLEGAALRSVCEGLFGEEATTLDTKWMRVMGRDEATSAHSDAYFFHPSSYPGLVVAWTPLEDVPWEKGPLAVCLRTHTLDEYDAGAGVPSDELPVVFADVVEKSDWRSTDFAAGDVLLFDTRTIHASAPNCTDHYRMSSDTRWQPKSTAYVPKRHK
eukprot:PLAT15311.1.p1 GENE.PLAT15311.1~~PLAT15311.1.p1  ORF type:complete len:272 (-),score=71.32 PLAT15311.1:61-876(-)